MSMRSLYLLSLLVAGGSAQAMSAGEYVAKAGDCTACHTAPGGAELAGGMKFPTPLGDIYATNITPDKEHGIGGYSFDEFDRAMRQGVAKDGHRLYPAMPYTSYAKMSAEDMRALYHYLMNEVPAQSTANRASDISWPLSMRWPLAVWNRLFHDDQVYRPDPQQSAEWNRGAYLVQGAGHCGSCHTPRGWAMQEQGLDGKEPAFLSGAELDGWYASDLRGMQPNEVMALLKTGRSQHAAVAGPMGEVVTHSTQYLSDADLKAIGNYLHSLAADPVPAVAAPAQADNQSGRASYAMYCSTCHGNKGEGSDNTIPALAGNATVTADNPLTALRVVLEGAQTPTTQHAAAIAMPGYAWTLNDRQAADLMSYLRGSWGNRAAPVTEQQVQEARKLQAK
ncbi:Alcohol dehydrogenase cytochrome c subunit precursor [Serratia entomophila]|uniref:c-type cytochrome n=1 Tax=Serratia entomophila TaxID=42906 RepID=UPI00217C0C6C|nr:cytochrome c [Serratia entomophila]CAI0987404.1 Alcohol dehydrogenase cytochrome c subunit precursor [Serratia entomophila]CAI1053238.1 Alcohol dehydrogenase cytochrome c subunit precursor [Serratia entomophila]CAI1068805.1 Alcohol dehydrogenase cytochrome c subunit precursor [Serratia entomophila]CAI1073580.1 Alcohol dehydrogenase cytochrome c subunit precursor [Serratia entomophila]CAI1083252.1 Alcohol dehydrogenase cytochrome c subunit precursor [Serratia entomophila]